MANQYGNQYQQNINNVPPLQTHNSYQGQRAFSPPSYQQSPGAMSPTMSGVPPAKRQRTSPNPPSPAYQSPFSASPYANASSPYGAGSPPGGQYLSLPQSPAAGYPAPSFNQPQPYQGPGDMNSRPQQGSMMPPPKVPASRNQDNAELEKANPRDMDVNNISDVLTGSGIDLRAEEEYLTQNSFQNRNAGASFNSQASGSTISPHGSFNWSQGASGHGAFQGNGPLSQSVSQEQQEAEVLRKHEAAARAYNESAQSPLTDPFLFAGTLRQKIATRAYQNGIQVNLDGLFDKIPETPQGATRTSVVNGSNGESITSITADSLLNQNAPFVEILSLMSLAAEDRMRTILEDAFALSQNRQNTSHGIVPPNLQDLAFADGDTQPTKAVQVNLSKTAWEAPDSAISPMTVLTSKNINAGRLPTPPTDAPPTPTPTVQFTNHVANALKRRVQDDFNWEQKRITKRKKRTEGATATPSETPVMAPLPVDINKATKKERDKANKLNQTDEVMHRKANETANMALGGGKKKYSWMMGGGGGGGGGGSGASTPRINTNVGSSGTSTPQQQQIDKNLIGTRRTYGTPIESGDIGRKIQVRDVVHALELDGKERKTLVRVLTQLKSTDRDGDIDKSKSAR